MECTATAGPGGGGVAEVVVYGAKREMTDRPW